jgi:hypothetical protein
MTFVVSDKTIKVAQYGQWDGYPAGQGRTILEFLRNNPDLSQFEKNLDNVRLPTPAEIRGWYVEAGMDPEDESGFITMDIADKFNEAHPSICRDMGGAVLQYINETTEPELALDLDFINDGLFCEWAYCVDLDEGYLEVYGGYDAEPLAEENRFGPDAIPLVAKYPLDALPTVEEFLAELEPDDE